MKKGEKVICIESNEPTTYKFNVYTINKIEGNLLDLGFKDEFGNVDWQRAKRFRSLENDNLILMLAFEAEKRSIERSDKPARIFTTTEKF